MVGGGLCCLFSFFTCSTMLLLGVCFYGVEASSCDSVIHKKVGDTVELPACVKTEEVKFGEWKYGEKRIAGSDAFKNHQFVGRLEMNPTNFSLTVRELTVNDSGEFKFLAEVGRGQGPTFTISLQVDEPITEQPVLTITNTTWLPSNESCTVFLECRSTSGGRVNYSWTVQGQTRDGPRLQHLIKNGDTGFNCTVRNHIDTKSAAITVRCSNETQRASLGDFVMLMGAAGGGCLLIVIVVGIVVGVCACKRREAGSDSNDLTLYADITEVGIDEPRRKPSTVYETIDHRTNNGTPGTVYDKIQLSRMRNTTVEPFHVL